MKTVKQLLRESMAGDGDCFVTAGRIALMGDKGLDTDRLRLVHALVMGQGELEGVRFSHAWVEQDGTVYDYSNGNELEVPVQVYYAIGNIRSEEPGAYASYNVEEAREMVLETEHWGPWELELSKEGPVVGESHDNRSRSRDAIFPTKKRKVGKKRVRLSRNQIMGK